MFEWYFDFKLILIFIWISIWHIEVWTKGRHVQDDIFECICGNEKCCILIPIWLRYVAKGNTDNSALTNILGVYMSQQKWMSWLWNNQLKYLCVSFSEIGHFRHWVSVSSVDILLIGSSHTANSLHWRHNGRDSVSNYQPHYCLLNRLFRRRSKKTNSPHKWSVTRNMFPFDDVIINSFYVMLGITSNLYEVDV